MKNVKKTWQQLEEEHKNATREDSVALQKQAVTGIFDLYHATTDYILKMEEGGIWTAKKIDSSGLQEIRFMVEKIDSTNFETICRTAVIEKCKIVFYASILEDEKANFETIRQCFLDEKILLLDDAKFNDILS